jgi:Kdo2-lipid IVA lauroyltransferase/acyltransferase
VRLLIGFMFLCLLYDAGRPAPLEARHAPIIVDLGCGWRIDSGPLSCWVGPRVGKQVGEKPGEAAWWDTGGTTIKRQLSILFLRLLALLPWTALQALGRAFGELLVLLPNRQRRDALINLRLCFPDIDEPQRNALRRRSIIHFAKTYTEIAALWLWPPERVLALIREQQGTELLEREPGRGLIVLAPHIGAWELCNVWLATQGPISNMYRPQRHIDDLIRHARQRNGARLVPDNVGGVKAMLKALRRGEMVGILPDQVVRADQGAVFAPFFGEPAVTMLLVAGLMRRTGARAVVIGAERLPGGRGFRLHCLPAPDGLDSPDDVEAATALNRGVEQIIERFPDQYHWTYRRFRRRPNGRPNPYVGPSI